VIGDLPGGEPVPGFEFATGQARLASNGGALISGNGRGTSGPEAWIWTQAGGMVGIGDLAGGIFESRIASMSPDGSILLGASYGTHGQGSFLWTHAGGMEALDVVPAGMPNAGNGWNAIDLTPNAEFIVGGSAFPGALHEQAVVWDATNGLRLVSDVLVTGIGVDLGDWQLVRASQVSADGTILAGDGLNPDGDREGWIATLPSRIDAIATVPEPSCSALAAIAGLASCKRVSSAGTKWRRARRVVDSRFLSARG
jgi:hypothetical protein